MPVADVVAEDSSFALQLPHLEASLLDSFIWRAVVANPTGEWSTIKAQADAWLGVQDFDSGRATALGKVIYLLADNETFPDHTNASWPTALIRHLNDNDAEQLAIGFFACKGVLLCTLELQIPDVYLNESRTDGFRNATRWAENIAGRVAAELQQRTDVAGRLFVDRAEIATNGFVNPKATGGVLIHTTEILVYHSGV